MRNREEVYSELTKIMNELFEVPVSDVRPEARFFEDLGLDSIDAIDLISELQSMIDERVNPEDFKSVRTVGDVVDIISSMIERRQSEA